MREKWGMTLTPVNYSAIHAVGDTHPGVPYEVCAGLMSASSKGAYYNRYIRGR
jgi:hypothetical protein